MPTSSSRNPTVIMSMPLHMLVMRRVRVTLEVLQSRTVERGARGGAGATTSVCASAMMGLVAGGAAARCAVGALVER